MPVNHKWLQNNLNYIMERLFYAEHKRLKNQLSQLVKENTLAGGSSDGFYFRGIFYSDLSNYKALVKTTIALSVIPQAEVHYGDEKKISIDKTRIRQALALVLSNCYTHQDIRDAIPNSLASMIDDLKNLPRLNEEAFTLKNDPRMYNQYMKVKPLIEFYVTARLLY